MLIAPFIQSALKEKEKNKFQQKLNKLLLLNLIFSIFTFFIIMIFGRSLLLFFGEGFKSAYPCLKVLSITHLIRSLFGPSRIILIMSKFKKHVFFSLLVSLIIHLTFNYIFIKNFGVVGVAIIELISIFSIHIYYDYLCTKKLDIVVNVSNLLDYKNIKKT